MNELQPGTLFAVYRIGTIRHFLGHFAEALSQFRECLRLIETNDITDVDPLPIQICMATTIMSQANEKYLLGAYGAAVSLQKESLCILYNVLKQNQDVQAIWRLIGDVLFSFQKLKVYESEFPVDIIDELCLLAESKLSPNVVIPEKKRDVHLYAAALFFAKCFQDTQDADVAFKLAKTYNEMDDEKMAVKYIQLALEKDPPNCKYWNMLGVLLMSSNPTISQHAFIKSIELDTTVS